MTAALFMLRRRHTILFLAVTLACGTADAPEADRAISPDRPTIVEVALVDSVPYENELTSGYLRRVVVRTPERADTLPGILADVPPVVVGDSVVYGILADEQFVDGLFAFDVGTRHTRLLPPLPGLVSHGAPRLAPDGRHVAYLAQTPTDQGYGAIATIPDGRIVYRGPAADMRATDAGVDVIRWHDAARFEIHIDLPYEAGGAQRLRGTLAPLRVVVDTIPPPAAP